ncbi:MAG: biotin transporter BioY [Erysipelotrichaceae bacterium]|nr:biotin transporter BioY [Erysipelotrichaceae bacterium]
MKLTVKQLCLCSLFSALIAVGAFLKITIPLNPVTMHFTLQWLFVLLASLLLENRTGSYSVGIYLSMGLLGVPIFAAGGGPGYIMRPTFGFLLGFYIASIIMDILVQWFKETPIQLTIISIIGLLVYYATGILYYYFMQNYILHIPVGWQLAIINCCMTLIPDFILCICAVMITLRIKPHLKGHL